MNAEERKLNEWLLAKGLKRHVKDPFGLISVFERTEWIMNLFSIYKVIQLNFAAVFVYLFNADKKTSRRAYRTYGCILMKIPVHRRLFLFSGGKVDLSGMNIRPDMKRQVNFESERLRNMFDIYAEDKSDAQRVLSLLEPVLLGPISGDLIIEIRDNHLLILRDEYFKYTDIEESLNLAKNIHTAFYQ